MEDEDVRFDGGTSKGEFCNLNSTYTDYLHSEDCPLLSCAVVTMGTLVSLKVL